MVGLQEKSDLLRSVFTYLSKVDFKRSSTPELTGEIFSLLKKETGNNDPYEETRTRYNKMFLDRIPELEQKINESDNPFLESIKYAIIGNIIDFNPIHDLTVSDVEAYFTKLKKEKLELDDSTLLIQEVHRANTLLYLGDNCGEICLDKILTKKIKEINPSCHVFFATRGSAVVNDSVEFQAIYEKADIVIAKGQANYECLSDEEKNIFSFL